MSDEIAVKEEKKEIATAESKNKVTDFSLGIFGTSDNFIMATQMAKALASSTIVPSTFQNNVSNCILGIEIAQRLNTSPLLVMQNLYVIQGRPSWSSQYLIALINASGKYDIELQYEEEKKNGKPFSCTCWTMRKGRKVEGITIDMDMAEREGWLNKPGSKWKTIPQVMLRYRAAAFFARMNCPEVSLGFYTQEETIDVDFNEVPLQSLQEQVQHEIEQQANNKEFVPDDAHAGENKSDLPPFLQ